MPETIILTAAPPNKEGRRLSYVVEGEPLAVATELEIAREKGVLYPVPDRDDEGEYTYLNAEQVVAVYRKPVR